MKTPRIPRVAVFAAMIFVDCGDGLDDCQKATTHVLACFGVAPGDGVPYGEPPPPCTGYSECTSKCYLQASCDEILDSSFSFARGRPASIGIMFDTCMAKCPPPQ
jgi:hypothetical protein